MPTTPRKRKPTDSTMRNVRAANKRMVYVANVLVDQEKRMRSLEQRVAALERTAKAAKRR